MVTQNARSLLALLIAPLLSGCGLEGLLNLYGGTDYQQPVSVVAGAVAMPPENTTLRAIDANGEEVVPFATSVSEGRYEMQFISGEYSNLRIQATAGQAIVEAFVPALGKEERLEGIDLTVTSTAVVKIVEGLSGVEERPLVQLSRDEVCIAEKRIRRATESGDGAFMVTMMSRVLDRANTSLDTTSYVFQQPKVLPDLTVEESPLSPAFVARTNFDYDNNGSLNQTTEAFDVVYVSVLSGLELAAPPDPDRVRVVFSVDFNEGKLSGSCGALNRFRWVRDEPGKQMYFVGGIHQTSPVQDTQIDAMLGNRGGWTPNVIPMYDDGTNGDRVAGDGIWSIYFDLPRGLRMGYKYTWGNQGDLWTGTEEWPGNQRILSVIDRNDDGYVYRIDNFADESSNKDLPNSAAGGSLDWDEDVNGDGFPEAGEVPVDSLGNYCGPDREFVTPEWVPAVSISCEEFDG